MADGLLRAAHRKLLIRVLRPVFRSKVFDGVTDFGQELHRCRGHVDRTPAPKFVDPPRARRIILYTGSRTEPRMRNDFSEAGKVNENGLQELSHPRERRRRHRRTPTLRLHVPTTEKQGPRQIDIMLLDRLT